MAFTDTQTKALKAKLHYRHVKSREQDGVPLSYVEGWHVVAEANRIFGFDSWDRQTQTPECHWTAVQRGQTVCFYSAKVRITVRAGGTVTIREGIGTGLGRSLSPEIAHELALKAAETDATKRALATFGNPFGLALYDRDQSFVTKPRRKAGTTGAATHAHPALVLTLPGDHKEAFDRADTFGAAIMDAIKAITTVADVYAFWTSNLAALAELQHRGDGQGNGKLAQSIIDALKSRLREIGDANAAIAAPPALPPSAATKAALLLPKEKRIRDGAHLAFVASQPCLVCGRRPAQAHHLRFAQPRAMSMKVSDEFTLPLCNTHHDSVHKTGDERAWWAQHGIIEPLKFAERLWTASRLDARSADCEDVDVVGVSEAGHSPGHNGAPVPAAARNEPEA